MIEFGGEIIFFFGFLFLSINFLIKYAKLGVFAAGGSEDYYNSANWRQALLISEYGPVYAEWDVLCGPRCSFLQWQPRR